MRIKGRCGFSLLEVILALAIMAGAMAVLGDIVGQARRNAWGARDTTRAQLLCESKLNEITAGITAPDSVPLTPCDTDPDWLYSVDQETIDQQGLLAVRVTVRQALDSEKQPVEVSIVRWIIDPNSAAALSSQDASTSGTATSTSGTGM